MSGGYDPQRYGPQVRRGGGLPFGQFVSQWMCDPRYSTNARTLYGVLVTYADVGARDTSRGKPWRSELAAQLGCSLSTLDRTLFEGECAGLWHVEEVTHPAPTGAKIHDANIYHLHDALFWRGEWVDPLAPGESAAEVAKARLAKRRAEKKAAGILPKGGRRRTAPVEDGGGVTGEATVPKRGGFTHDATPGVTGEARGGVTDDAHVYIPEVENPDREPAAPSVRPSVPVEDARGRDGRTDGGDAAAVQQEEMPTPAGEPEGSATPDNSARGDGGTPGPVFGVRPVDLTPGVRVLRAIAAEAPAWTITHAETLRDQGLAVTGMLASGFTAQEIRHALLARPLPQPLLSTVGAIVARRLRDLLAVGPASAVPPIPAQQDLVQGSDMRGDRGETPVPATWAKRHAQLEAEVAGAGRHRPCAGDEGMCPRLALPGEDLCAVCLGGERPLCANGCGRGVVMAGMRCIACETEDETDVCRGHEGSCGRPVQTDGLCGRCRIAAEAARAAEDAERQVPQGTFVSG
ncbi:hypothetical protein ABZ135_23340 [Streptomyces sp. NPDC006339]|uniref:hypothetical protein n=1 Tax=Streptomyces sp. NPDC006339 TaxID=3156755 RepID=UPI0033AA22B6